jgi:alpha-tubulin suppressor-like RCC1 family protein
MHRSFIHLASAALTIISLAACTDHRDLLAPTKPSAAITGPGGPGVPQIQSPTDLMEISAGGFHTCVRRRSGQLLCWGLNTSSQVGVPTSAHCAGTSIFYPATIPCVTVATAVPLLTQSGTGPAVGAAHVTLGNAHTCALDTQSIAWCWGDNSSGQVGRGPTMITQFPLPVTTSNNLTNLTFVSLGAGGDATCGSSSIGGGLMCWGQFPGSVGTKSTPTFVAAGSFTTVVVTSDHGCVNGFTNGQWDCWGSNASGQLGQPPATLPSSPPFVTVHPMDNAPAIAVANGITCNDEPNPGSAQCFGTNLLSSTVGLLGNPQDLAAFDPLPQNAGPFHGVSIGVNHGCALDAANAAWCWGINSRGQLGSGSFQSSTTPVAVQGGLTFRSLAVGLDFSCGIAIDNHAYCWGDNYDGQLGNGGWSFAGIATPVRVSGL